MQIPEGDQVASKQNTTSRREFVKKVGKLGFFSALSLCMGDSVSQLLHNLTADKPHGALAGTIEKMKKERRELNQRCDSEERAQSIESACKANQLPYTKENICIILTLLQSSSGLRSSPRAIDFIPTPAEVSFYETGIMKPKTCGPLETSIDFVMQEYNLDYDAAIKKVTTNKEGVGIGVNFLKRIINQYTSVEDPEKRLRCIFADFNAGLGSCIRAGVQETVSNLSGVHLHKDGRLGNDTIFAISKAFAKKQIHIPDDVIAKDCRSMNLHDTATYQAICGLTPSGCIDPQIAETPVPGITGTAKKILTGVGNAKDYANERVKEYNKIAKMYDETST